MTDNAPKWIEIYLLKGWYQPHLSYAHPDCPYHYIYQRRVNRWCGLIIGLIVLYAAYDLIDWATHGKDIGFYTFFTVVGCVVAFLIAYIVVGILCWLYEWLSGR